MKILKEDPDDNMLFACALALEAKIIVTGDKAFRSIGRYMDIVVMTPAEFAKRYGGE